MTTYRIPDGARRLAMLASLAARIEPELLRAIRLRLLPDVDVAAEADLWFSDLVEARSTMRIVLRADVAATLRDSLAADRTALEEARKVIAAVHAQAAAAVQLEEELTYLALRGGDDAGEAIERLMLSVLYSAAVEGRRGLAEWAARVLPRMPSAVRATPAAAALSLVSGSRTTEAMPTRAAALRDPAVAAVIGDVLPVAAVYVRVRATLEPDYVVELSAAPLDGGQEIAVPGTDPLLVELSTANGTEVLEIPREGSVMRRAGSHVTIRTIGGVVIEVTPGLPGIGSIVRGTIVSIFGGETFIAYGGPSEAVMDAAELEGLDIGDQVEGEVVANSPDVRLSRNSLRFALQPLRAAFENKQPIEGHVGARNKGGFTVSFGRVTAFCPLSQIALGKVGDPDSHLGQTLEFLITDMSADGRRIVVSRAALLKNAARQQAEETRRRLIPGAELTGRVKSLAQFGAFIDLGGVDGLVHVSEMSRRRVLHPGEIVNVGDEVTVRVIKVEGTRVSLSMKEFEPDPWSTASTRYPAGTPFSGRVVRATAFGIFVELEPGLDGLVHVSNYPRGIKHGDPEIGIGTTVHGWVREIDAGKKRLSLSLRPVAVNDPWVTAARRYPVGKVVQGTVDHQGSPGVFVELEPGLLGLIPNAEIITPREYRPGEILPVRIMSLDSERKRISLSYDATAWVEGEQTEKSLAEAFRRAMEGRKKPK